MPVLSERLPNRPCLLYDFLDLFRELPILVARSQEVVARPELFHQRDAICTQLLELGETFIMAFILYATCHERNRHTAMG